MAKRFGVKLGEVDLILYNCGGWTGGWRSLKAV